MSKVYGGYRGTTNRPTSTPVVNAPPYRPNPPVYGSPPPKQTLAFDPSPGYNPGHPQFPPGYGDSQGYRVVPAPPPPASRPRYVVPPVASSSNSYKMPPNYVNPTSSVAGYPSQPSPTPNSPYCRLDNMHNSKSFPPKKPPIPLTALSSYPCIC